MNKQLRFGSFALSIDERQLTCEGTCIHLTPKAFDLLVVLIEESPRVVHKRELHDRLWPRTFVADSTLVGLVKELRRALKDGSPGTTIRTAHRVGYAFAAPIDHGTSEQTDGARWLAIGARRHPLVLGENMIGRGASASVRVDVLGISRRHARIQVDSRRAIIEDLGSKNGTLIKNVRIRTPIELRDGDEINVAGVTVIFRACADNISTENVGMDAEKIACERQGK